MEIRELKAVSCKSYGIDKIEQGCLQYMDRAYRFNYVPDELNNQIHIKPCGDDKLIGEDEECFSFTCDEDIEVYVLFADKHPILPKWLESYERTRLNVTRFDSSSDNLKGYFSAYKKSFSKGVVSLCGCSVNELLQEKWYIDSGGENYCMYSVCIKAPSF